MSKRSFLSCLLVSATCCFLQAQHFQVPNTEGMRWFKGNPSVHSKNDLGDSTLEEIVRWYKAHGYNFLSITDHYQITYSKTLASSADPPFILIAGIADTVYGNLVDVDVLGLNVTEALPPRMKPSILTALQESIDAIRKQGGIPIIFHPNFKWTVDKDTLLRIRDCNLFELHGAFPRFNSQGDEHHPSMEYVWDCLLTAGRRFYGVTADDTYYFKYSSGQYFSSPGSAWVMLKAKRLDPTEISRNLEEGFFYSTTGVVLEDINITPNRITIVIKEDNNSSYLTEFIGSNGRLLLSCKDNPAVYILQDKTNYVRAKVVDAKGDVAWVQPIFVEN